MSSIVRAQKLLEEALGAGAKFREHQLEAILALVDDRQRVLLVQRTGWGKSVVYFIATALLREQGAGPTILISPLLSLMRDQVRMADRLGVNAASINSSNDEHWEQIEAELHAGRLDVLLISPERLANERFRNHTLARIPNGLGLFVVDEAHCISDWGHDFRPDYRRIESLVGQLPSGIPLLATTATANNRVVTDIAEQLGMSSRVIRGPLGRESLHLQVVELPSQAQRLAWLATYLSKAPGSGIVYSLTQHDAQMVSDWLASRGIDAPAYTGALDSESRELLEQRLRDDDVKALVATVALGMGFDKPDLAFVVHYQRPGSPIAYYQQIGRAGRGIDRAEVILLAGEEDDAIADYFIESSFPPPEELEMVISVLQDAEELTVAALRSRVNLSNAAIMRALKVLKVEGAVSRDGVRYARTPNPWSADTQRAERVTAQRIHERERMSALAGTEECLMAFLRRELDDPASEPCGVCANCAGPFVPLAPEPADVVEAAHFLRRTHLPIEPRKQWPIGLNGYSGAIAVEHRLREGRALCRWGDAGLGQIVKDGKYRDGSFDESLLEAVVEMLMDHWQPPLAPRWVTAVPSLRAVELVPGFARQLADRLRLPYREALLKSVDTPQQKTMENGNHQAANALRSFRAVPEVVIREPVLLVDDMVDSRWSLTVCGVLLAQAGSGAVIPIALAQTSKGR